ncbi:MAG: hypothetical protein V4640_03025 [Verrucomicrobiota bacterium]
MHRAEFDKRPAGFILPAVLVIVAALLVLAIGTLLVTGIERDGARAAADRHRAELAARAGLEQLRAILLAETANDDFLILQDDRASDDSLRQSAPFLYLVRGSGGGDALSFRYLPLFSTASFPKDNADLTTPPRPLLEKGKTTSLPTLPWLAPVEVEWLEIPDERGRVVSRFAFWVEDLQGRVDAATAGNIEDNGKHLRYGWKAGDKSPQARFPAPGLNAEEAGPALDQVALHTLDPASGAVDRSDFDKNVIEGRAALISPDSVLAAAGFSPPLERDKDGHLLDPLRRAAEESLSATVRAYDEQPRVPFAHGIDASATGEPKRNLNELLAMPGARAVDEMAAWLVKCLPDFETRQGGFPEDYAKTFAANAISYASPGNAPLARADVYRGLGNCPVVSEIVLGINYLGHVIENGDRIMNYQFILFAELLNHTNLPVQGDVALSYEVGLRLPAMGAAPAGTRFDDTHLMNDAAACSHDVVEKGGRYWSKPLAVSLAPGEYRFFRFATVDYRINIGPAKVSPIFSLTEARGAAGLSVMWNGAEVDRIPSIMRDSYGLTFSIGVKRFTGKAAIPGHSYGSPGEYINNMGDPRIARYVTGIPLSENAFPENISPHRRNVRMGTIYQWDKTPGKLKTYGRVIPSEWPDGGHDAAVMPWDNGWDKVREGIVNPKGGGISGTGPPYDPTLIGGATLPEEGEALTYLSDRGRYFSATELGRVYDPVQWLPTFEPKSGLDSTVLRGDGSPAATNGLMPATGAAWPLVQLGNKASPWFGGGNTLRIGRPEHPAFDGAAGDAPSKMPGTHAARLLDLFHAGKSRSSDAAEREGKLVRIEGHVNLNTATRDALRAMAAGRLTMDPRLSKRTADDFDSRMAPPVSPLDDLSAPTADREADLVADAILRGRPFTSPAEIVRVTDEHGEPVFGNTQVYQDESKVQWSDSAAEEIFGRVYESSTVRSRNFRVWVIGQSLSPGPSGNPKPEVLAEVRKVYTVFADPGQRDADGTISSEKFRVSIPHESEF